MHYPSSKTFCFVARISQMTARKRLIEFSKTPSSALSIDAFFSVDYDEEQDPPCFGQPAQKRRFVGLFHCY